MTYFIEIDIILKTQRQIFRKNQIWIINLRDLTIQELVQYNILLN